MFVIGKVFREYVACEDEKFRFVWLFSIKQKGYICSQMMRNVWPIKLYGTAVIFKCAVDFRIEVFLWRLDDVLIRARKSSTFEQVYLG